MSTTLGDKIRELRKKKGMTLEELAHAVDSGKSYIWELENKGVKRPSAEKLADIAKVLGITSEYLLDDTVSNDADKNAAVDQALFRKYQKLPDKTKEKIRKHLELFWEDND